MLVIILESQYDGDHYGMGNSPEVVQLLKFPKFKPNIQTFGCIEHDYVKKSLLRLIEKFWPQRKHQICKNRENCVNRWTFSTKYWKHFLTIFMMTSAI